MTGPAPYLPPAGPPHRLGDAELQRLLAVAHDLEANRHAANTCKAYRSDFAHFTDWCSWAGLPALPAEPQTVYLYLSALVESGNAADWAISTLDHRLAAIAWVHETAGHLSPTGHVRVRELMAGIRRTHGRPAAKGRRADH